MVRSRTRTRTRTGFTAAVLSCTSPWQVSDNGTNTAPCPASLEEQAGAPVTKEGPLGR